MRYIIGQINVNYILKRSYNRKYQSESLTLNSDFAGSRPVVVSYIFFMQIIFLNLSYLLLVCISEVFEFNHVFSIFYQLYKSLIMDVLMGQMQLTYHKLIYNIEYAYVTIIKI